MINGVIVKAGPTLDWTHGLDYGPIFGLSFGPMWSSTTSICHSKSVI